ncbi:MAG: hypothetical protein ACLP8X_30510 [Streptosporangiaceae bacterium]|jgi:hypothetical protein
MLSRTAGTPHRTAPEKQGRILLQTPHVMYVVEDDIITIERVDLLV